MADATPRAFCAASRPRERFYLSCDQRRSASVEPHSWTSRWAFRRGFLVTLRSKFAGDWRTNQTLRTLDLGEAIATAKRWVASQERAS